MGAAVIVEAVRTPIGRRGGVLSGLHAVQDPSGNLVEQFQPTIPQARERAAFEQRHQE